MQTHLIVTGRNTRWDREVEVLDGASFLAAEERLIPGDSPVDSKRIRDEEKGQRVDARLCAVCARERDLAIARHLDGDGDVGASMIRTESEV